MLFLFFVMGAVVGSFLGALTWRWPRGSSILDGRSRCSHCGHTIRWLDNIPIISFLLLHGRCRDCKKKIPRRDFYIEAGMAILFAFTYLCVPQILVNIPWINNVHDQVALITIFIMVALAAAIFIIDFEHQYIPDTLAFLLGGVAILIILATDNSFLFQYLATGFGASLFLLIINLATLGRGMGLGDVKLAIGMGIILGFPLSVVWMFLSFVLGSIVGIILIIFKLAKFKQRIAFGPFLVAGFYLTMVFGNKLLNFIAIL